MPVNADPAKPENENEIDAGDDKSIDSKINIAVKAHLKREMKAATEALSKTLGEQIAKSLEGFKPPAVKDDAAGDGKGKEDKPDPKVKLLEEKLEKLSKSYQDAESRSKALEEKSRKDAARSAIAAALEGKGIKGARARAVLADLEQSGALKFSDDGSPTLTISRVRAKGGRAEPLEFDLAEGIDDWAKTADAAEFLPAPGARETTRAAANASQQAGTRKAPKAYDAPPMTDAEAVRRTAEHLEAMGVDVNNLSEI